MKSITLSSNLFKTVIKFLFSNRTHDIYDVALHLESIGYELNLSKVDKLLCHLKKQRYLYEDKFGIYSVTDKAIFSKYF